MCDQGFLYFVLNPCSELRATLFFFQESNCASAKRLKFIVYSKLFGHMYLRRTLTFDTFWISFNLKFQQLFTHERCACLDEEVVVEVS